MASRAGDFVSVVAEANAWPYDAVAEKSAYPDEIVHVVARRLSTGETFDRVLRPSHPLAPNVENLTVHQDFNYAVGNSLDNLIQVDGRQWVYGGAGHDVLVGATNTTTTFVVRAGEGNDVIYNWQGADQLQLSGYGLSTPDQIRATMQQQGADNVFHFGNGETLTVRSTTPASFQERQFLVPLDTSKLGALAGST